MNGCDNKQVVEHWTVVLDTGQLSSTVRTATRQSICVAIQFGWSICNLEVVLLQI